MNKRLIVLFFMAALVVLIPSIADAEVIVLKNGMTLQGEIYRITGDFVYIRVETGPGTVVLPIDEWDQVRTRKLQFSKTPKKPKKTQ